MSDAANSAAYWSTARLWAPRRTGLTSRLADIPGTLGRRWNSGANRLPARCYRSRQRHAGSVRRLPNVLRWPNHPISAVARPDPVVCRSAQCVTEPIEERDAAALFLYITLIMNDRARGQPAPPLCLGDGTGPHGRTCRLTRRVISLISTGASRLALHAESRALVGRHTPSAHAVGMIRWVH